LVYFDALSKVKSLLLYNISIQLFRFGIWVASLVNPKAKLFTKGRKGIFKNLTRDIQSNPAPVIWVHCSSLGEFEQGRPMIEAFKKEFPHHRILLTFFSPSGYEIRKKYDGADMVYYLPLDTAGNAERWVQVTRPVLAVFIKYEFWANYCMALKALNIPLISVSSIFRPNQVFFRSYGSLFRRVLGCFSHFFVQDTSSASLLQSIGLTNVTVSGDTRFDRVRMLIQSPRNIAVAESFKGTDHLLVAGSVWEEDLEVLIPFINESALKFIVAPHEISEDHLLQIERSVQGAKIRYSQAVSVPDLSAYKVLLIDNIGLLSGLYRYGEFAFIGGGFGKGLHNILEAACYGIPVFFGNKNYQKFREAKELIMRGGAFEVRDFADFKGKYELLNLPEQFLLACDVTKAYVMENLGAAEKVMKYCRPILSK
jgi:3-deoxy-D-manno-octulosonic-acid transferase